MTLLGQTIAFIFFVWFCMKYIWPPLVASIEERQNIINKGLSDAQKAKDSLILAQQEANDYIKNAKIKAHKIINEANEQKISIIEEAKLKALDEAKVKKEQAEADIEASFAKAKKELINQISSFSIMGAEKILNSKITNDAQNALIDDLIKEIHKEEYV